MLTLYDVTDEDVAYIINKHKRYNKDIAIEAGVHPNTIINWLSKGIPKSIIELKKVLNVCGYDLRITKGD